MTYGAQIDRIAGLQQIDRAGGHHPAPSEIVTGAPVEILKHEGHALLCGGVFQNALTWRDYLGAHTIAGWKPLPQRPPPLCRPY